MESFTVATVQHSKNNGLVRRCPTMPPAGVGRRRRRGGQALIELAFVVSVLLVLTMGLIQYGIIYNATVTLTNIARDGARFAAINGRLSTVSDDDIKTHMISVAANTRITIARNKISIVPAYGARAVGQKVTVTLGYDMAPKLFLPTSFPGLGRFASDHNTTAAMIVERD